MLDDAQFIDMFWVSYAIAARNAEAYAIVHDAEMWMRNRFAFRNRRTGEVAPHAFCGGSPPFVRDGRVAMRGLYLHERSALERVCIHLIVRLDRVRRCIRGRLRSDG